MHQREKTAVAESSVHGGAGEAIRLPLKLGVLLLAVLMLGSFSIAIRFGTYVPATLLTTSTTAVLLGVGIMSVSRTRVLPTLDEKLMIPTLLCYAVVNAGASIQQTVDHELPGWAVTQLPLIAAILGILALFGPVRRRWIPTAMAAFTLLIAGVETIRADARPKIDVWIFLTQGASGLLKGTNQYSSCWVANTDRHTDCIYAYLPGTAIVTAPVRALFGDVRYAWLGCIAFASLLIWRVAGPRMGPVLAMMIPLQPLWLYMVDKAWPEPLAFAGLCLMMWSVRTRRMALAIVALAVVLTTKQTMAVLIPLAAWWPEFGPRRTAKSAGLALLVMLPWIVWSPRDFVHDTVVFHLTLPPRLDALSLQSLLLRHGIHLPVAVSLLVTAAAVALAMWRLPRNGFGFALGSAFVLLSFNLMFKVAFFNEHSIVLWLVVLALASAESAGRPVEKPVSGAAGGEDAARRSAAMALQN